jgi:DNA-binding MarR family transcriptional regulator
MEQARLQRTRLPRTIDREAYTPAYLALVSNALSWGGSQLYTRRFGVGVNDWRVISALGNHPGSTAVEVCTVVGLDKSVVSRCVAGLAERGLVGIERTDGHRRLFLTQDGVRLHDELLPLALHREQVLLEGLEASEVEQLKSFLRRMFLNLPRLNDDPVRDGDSTGTGTASPPGPSPEIVAP